MGCKARHSLFVRFRQETLYILVTRFYTQRQSLDLMVRHLFRAEAASLNKVGAEEECWSMRKNGSFIVSALIAITAVAVAGLMAGTETGREAVKQAYDGVKKRLIGGQPPSQSFISDAEIAYATTNMFHLFRDAQYDYIHRHDGVMARSITELGDGFSIGSFGSLIHEEIWLARFERPEADYIPRSKQSRLERDILDRPYRYAILSVENCFGEKADKRTTCILAIPVAPDAKPMLVMIGGPIRSDPQDFYKPCPIHKVFDPVARTAFREAATAGASISISADFFNSKLPGWNASQPNPESASTATQD